MHYAVYTTTTTATTIVTATRRGTYDHNNIIMGNRHGDVPIHISYDIIRILLLHCGATDDGGGGVFFYFLAANFVLILYLQERYLQHRCGDIRTSRFFIFSSRPFCYLVRVIEFWRYCTRCVFLSCQPVKVVGRPARNTELSRGVTLEIDRSPDARACIRIQTYRSRRRCRFFLKLLAGQWPDRPKVCALQGLAVILCIQCPASLKYSQTR